MKACITLILKNSDYSGPPSGRRRLEDARPDCRAAKRGRNTNASPGSRRPAHTGPSSFHRHHLSFLESPAGAGMRIKTRDFQSRDDSLAVSARILPPPETGDRNGFAIAGKGDIEPFAIPLIFPAYRDGHGVRYLFALPYGSLDDSRKECPPARHGSCGGALHTFVDCFPRPAAR